MRLIDGDYLYNKLVANKCPYDLVLQMIKDEPTVCDIEDIKTEIADLMSHDDYMVDGMNIIEIIDKYTK